jgi:hypothetical protein
MTNHEPPGEPPRKSGITAGFSFSKGQTKAKSARDNIEYFHNALVLLLLQKGAANDTDRSLDADESRTS